MRTAATLALVALLVLTGCAQFVPAGPETPTRQPTVQGTPAPPPGVSVEGVTDPSGLLAAHRRALVDGGFVLTTATTRRGPGAPNVTTSRRIVAAPDLAAHRHRVTEVLDGGRTVDRQRWTDGATGARRVLENGTVVGRGPYDGGDAAALTRVHRLRWFLRHGDFAVTPTVGRERTVGYLLRADGPVAPGGGGRGHLSARAVVTPRGRIESLVATVTLPAEDESGVRVESYEYHLRESGGVTVTRPDWADRVVGGRTGPAPDRRIGGEMDGLIREMVDG